MTEPPRSARDWLAVINDLSAKDTVGPPGPAGTAVLTAEREVPATSDDTAADAYDDTYDDALGAREVEEPQVTDLPVPEPPVQQAQVQQAQVQQAQVQQAQVEVVEPIHTGETVEADVIEAADVVQVAETADLVRTMDVPETVDVLDVDEITGAVDDLDSPVDPDDGSLTPRRALVHTLVSAPGRAARRIGGLSRRWVALVAVLLVAVVTLGVLTGLRLSTVRSDDQRAATRTAVSTAAGHEVLDLLTLSGASTAAAQKQLTDLLSGATGNFRQQFATNQQALVAALVAKKVDQKGAVNAVGITSITHATAITTVNGQSTVVNTDSPQGTLAYYRLQVTLQKVHGTWLVSDIGVIT
jgi:Mce-associated membrane protein